MENTKLKALAFLEMDETGKTLMNHYQITKENKIDITQMQPFWHTESVKSALELHKPNVVFIDASLVNMEIDFLRELKSTLNYPIVLVTFAFPNTEIFNNLKSNEGGTIDLVFEKQVSETKLPVITREVTEKFILNSEGFNKGAFHDLPKTIQDIMSANKPGAINKQIIVISSKKGGVGKTSIARELALTLAIYGKIKVCLVDINMNGGHIGSSLNIPTGTSAYKNIVDFARTYGMSSTDTDRISRFTKAIEESVYRDPKERDLYVIPGIKTQRNASSDFLAGQSGLDFTKYLLNFLYQHQNFEFVVVDCGSSLNSGPHVGALQAATKILVVTDADINSLRDAKTFVSDLTSSDGLFAKSISDIHLVINKWFDNVNIPLDEVPKQVKIGSIATIPFDLSGSIISASNDGHSFVAKYGTKTDNPKTVDDTLNGLWSLAAFFYPPIGSIASNRKLIGKQNVEKEKKVGTRTIILVVVFVVLVMILIAVLLLTRGL